MCYSLPCPLTPDTLTTNSNIIKNTNHTLYKSSVCSKVTEYTVVLLIALSDRGLSVTWMSLYILQTSQETKRQGGQDALAPPSPQHNLSACFCIYVSWGHQFRPLLQDEIYAAALSEQLRCFLVNLLRKTAKRRSLEIKVAPWNLCMDPLVLLAFIYLLKCFMDIWMISGKTFTFPICIQ